MCGRFTLRKPIGKIAIGDHEVIEIDNLETLEPIRARYNIAPTQSVVTLRPNNGNRRLAATPMNWGFPSQWGKDSLKPLFNARIESIAEKPTFRESFSKRRCIVPADGYYEWKQQDSKRIPYHFSLKGEPVFYLAGLWNPPIDRYPDSQPNFTILTTVSNQRISHYHHRMPVILRPSQIERWLLAPNTLGQLIEFRDELAVPYDNEPIEIHPANLSVNNARNEGPECLKPNPIPHKQQLDFGF